MIQPYIENFLRAVNEARDIFPMEEAPMLPDVLDEAVLCDYAPRQYIIVNEAFYGRKPVEKIEKAVRDICMALEKKPTADITRSQLNSKLENAIKELFGFKMCSIYWNGRRLGASSTIPQSRVLMGFNPRDVGFDNDGSPDKKGFYDKKHQMSVVVDAQTTMITLAHLTPEETTAVLLHEIGHNFDFTVNAIVGSWLTIIGTIMAVASTDTMTIDPVSGMSQSTGVDAGAVMQAGMDLYATTTGGKQMQQLYNMDDVIARTIPPFHRILEKARKIGFNIGKVVGAILSPVGAMAIPAAVLFAPLSNAMSYFERKSELFADSVATAYGYGAELASALNKLDQYMVKGEDVGKSSVLDPFYKLALFEQEIWQVMIGGHRSTQQRLIAMSNELDKELGSSGLSARDRQAIKAEKAKLMQQYKKLMSMDEGMQSKLVSTFRKMIDNWYAGKPYMFVKNFTGGEKAASNDDQI